MLDAVDFEPFLFRRRAEEALEIAARMQRLAAPIGGREQRHLDLRPIGRHRLVEVVVERMREVGLAEIVAVGAHLFFGERLRSRHPVAIHAAAMALGPQPVLHGLDLHVVPVLRERVVDAAVVAELAIEIGEALPDADRGQMLGLQAGDLPLVDGVVGDAAQADFAVRPRLHARPFDAVMKILGFARRPVLDVARRAAAAARIDAHDGIAVRNPLFRIADFPALVLVGRAGHHVRLLLLHALPGGLVAVFEVKPLAVRAVAEQNRITAFLDWPEHVAAQHEPVVHLDRHVPIDAHPVADLADFTIAHDFSLQLRSMPISWG